MRYIFIILTAVITSFFFFPFEFTFLRGPNTKMMVAAVGLLLAGWQMVKKKDGKISKDFFITSVIATVFSLVVFYSIVYNNTDDYAYTSYVVSMWVWFFAAYVCCFLIAQLHGNISVKLVADYLIAISAFQCIIALMIEYIPAVKSAVDAYVVRPDNVLEERLYGIGAVLDVAGGKFSTVLLMVAVIMCNNDIVKSNWKSLATYSFGFILISVIGSMIARTANIGMLLGLAYIIYRTGIWRLHIKYSTLKFWRVLTGMGFVLVVACVYFYNTSPIFQEWLRFGFEGFFNLVEKGKWETSSTEILQDMIVFPESFKTWMIGDGRMVDPTTGKYYMGSDIGYVLFIFHCGIIGLSVFASMFVYLTISCYKKFSQERHLFLLLLIFVFVYWTKVATDIFLVYAVFLCIPMVQKHKNNQMERI